MATLSLDWINSQWSVQNWTVLGSDNGGRAAEILNSLIATCERLVIDSLAHPRGIFERITTHPLALLAELVPDQWSTVRPTTADL